MYTKKQYEVSLYKIFTNIKKIHSVNSQSIPSVHHRHICNKTFSYFSPFLSPTNNSRYRRTFCNYFWLGLIVVVAINTTVWLQLPQHPAIWSPPGTGVACYRDLSPWREGHILQDIRYFYRCRPEKEVIKYHKFEIILNHLRPISNRRLLKIEKACYKLHLKAFL